MNCKLYYEAIDADAEFHAALVSVYGEKNAGTMRYTAEAHNHPDIREAYAAWRTRMDAWLSEMELGCSTDPLQGVRSISPNFMRQGMAPDMAGVRGNLMPEDARLGEITDAAARKALADGITPGDAFGGSTHLWVARNVEYRPETEFFVVTLISWRMADLSAQGEGYESAAHRAISLAKKTLESRAAEVKPAHKVRRTAPPGR